MLITEGLWSSATSRTIQNLQEQGLDTKQIAEKLHYTEKNVQAFSPYTKGAYGKEEKSSYSLQSRKYRERKQTAADKAVKPSSDVPKEYIREDDLSEFLSRQRDKHPIALKLHLELDLEGCSVQDMRILHTFEPEISSAAEQLSKSFKKPVSRIDKPGFFVYYCRVN